MKKFVLIAVIFSLILISCGGEDIFAGEAYRLKAEQGLKEIRNALAVYKISRGKYPDEVNWEKELRPYFRKERFPDPRWVTKRKMLVMSAKNDISQVRGILKELKRKIYFADTTLQKKIMDFLGPIDSSITFADYEVTEAVRYDYRDISPELLGLYEFVSHLKISNEKKEIMNRMERQHKKLNGEINDLKFEMIGEDSIFNNVVENAFKVTLNVIEGSYLNFKGKVAPTEESLTVHSDAIDNLILKLDAKKNSLLVKELNKLDEEITYYTRGKDNIEFLNYLNELKKKLPASMSLFDNYYHKNRENVIEANAVLNGYAALVNLHSLVKFYEDQHDSIPEGNLYELLKEDEDMKEIREDINSDPYLYLEDDGYRLETKALDKNKTPLVLKIDFINTYDNIVKQSFSKGPYYSTNDSNTIFFIFVKAKDKRQTIITIRPKFREEERRI